MEIYGIEYGFKLTVRAACEIAERCPGGELKNIDFKQLLKGGGSHGETIRQRIELILSLNRGWAEAQKFETGEDAPVLTAELLQTLAPAAFGDVFSAAVEALFEGLGVTVAVAEPKKDGDGARADAVP